MRLYLAVLVTLLLSAIAFSVWRQCAPTPTPAIPPDTVGAVVWRSRALEAEGRYAAAAHELHGARGLIAFFGAKLRDQDATRARIKTVYDTTVTTDTVGLAVTIAGSSLVLDVGLPSGTPGAVHPATTAPVDVGRCDDGLQIVGTKVLCDKPRFGHLELGVAPRAEFSATGLALQPVTAYARWTSSFRSTFELSADASLDGSWRITARKGIRLW